MGGFQDYSSSYVNHCTHTVTMDNIIMLGTLDIGFANNTSYSWTKLLAEHIITSQIK